MDSNGSESVEGYIVDLACIRRYPVSEMLERAVRHSKECVLMGHCVESGYGVIEDSGSVIPLDTHATPLIVDAARRSGRERGIRLRVHRHMRDDEMQTESVEEV